ncbi:hypothetical protein ES707_11029 [subsurface metagenome]
MANEGHALSREELVRTLTAYTGTTTSDGADDYTSLIDSKLKNVNDYLTGKSILILSGDALYETIGISSFSRTTGEITFGGALSCQIVAGVNFRVLNTLPESVHITSGLITMEGYDYVSGEYRRVAVNASGVLKADVEVAISSGLNVIVESGVYLASGIHVVADIAESGMGVQVQSGLHIEEVKTIYEIESGVIELTSGSFVTAALTSGGFVTAGLTSGGFVTAELISGGFVTADLISGGFVSALVSGTVALQSGGFVTAGLTSGGFVTAALTSGGFVSVQSGLGVLISGQHVFVESGVHVVSLSGTFHVVVDTGVISVSGETISVETPTAVLTRAILTPTADSGGTLLISGIVVAVTVKSLSGDIYIGGIAADDAPYSGYGFLLAAGEAWSLDIDNFNKIRVCAPVNSGDWVSYGGVK